MSCIYKGILKQFTGLHGTFSGIALSDTEALLDLSSFSRRTNWCAEREYAQSHRRNWLTLTSGHILSSLCQSEELNTIF